MNAPTFTPPPGSPPPPPADEDAAPTAAQLDLEQARLATRPMTARCPTCDHEWVAAFLPMNLTRCAELLKVAACPKGCRAGPLLGSMA